MPSITTRILPGEDPNALPAAEQALQAGQLVAFPTDTVYGLAARVSDETGIARLYTVKDRDSLKAIAVLVGRTDDLPLVAAGLNETARRLGERFWPGALTLVVPRRPGLPDLLSPLPTIGVRMPDHPLALALLRRTGPLAVTSANLSGGLNTITAQEVLAQLGGRIELILDGGTTPGGSPSTVVDCTGPGIKVLRVGPLSEADLLAALQPPGSPG